MQKLPNPAHEARRVRFVSLDGLERRDIELAGEIWLRDICEAKWSSREAMKLAAHMVRYMAAADPRQLALSRIEHQIQLGRDEILQALRMLRLYRAIEAYSTDGDELRVALYLSNLQRLQVLETRLRLDQLTRPLAVAERSPNPPSKWVPPAAFDGDGDADHLQNMPQAAV